MSDEPRGKFTSRAARPEDAETLIGLFNRAFHKQKDAGTATWKYFASPHGPSYTLLAEDQGVVGGAYSYVYRRAAWRGRPFVAAQASDAMVDVAFRKRGIFTSFDDAAARESASRGVPVCWAVAGRQSMHGFLKNGWKAIGVYRQYIAVLDAKRLLRNRLGPLAPVFAPFVSLGLALAGRARKRAARSERVVRAVERFDSRVDDLFAAVAPSLPIALVRDARYLDWRYVDTPTRKHHILIAERGTELDGYVVYESASASQGRGYVVDVLGRDPDAEDALLRAALAALAADGNALALCSTLPSPRVASMLARNGFFAHPKRTPFRTATPFIVRVLREDASPGAGDLLDPENWYVFDGDRDVEHVSPA